MNFGRCEECHEYKYLVGEGKCQEHVSWEPIRTGVEIRYSPTDPAFSLFIGDTLVNEPRVRSAGGDYDCVLVVTDMEILVEDEDGDPVQTFRFDSYPVSKPREAAVQDAVEWMTTNN